MLRHSRFVAAALYGAHAVPALADTDTQQWLSVSAKTDLSEVVTAHGEAVARFGDASGGLYELETSLLLGYKFSEKAVVWAGYVHNPSYAANNFVAIERRAREQITIDSFANIGSASLSGRIRVEQRWRDGVQGVGWRVRPYLKIAVPLGDQAAPTLNFTAEPFLNLNTTSFQSASGLDRLRSAVALSVPAGKGVKVEAGYLNQHRFVREGTDRGDHALIASLAFSF